MRSRSPAVPAAFCVLAVTALAACGGTADRAAREEARPPAAPADAPLLVAALGDSITAGSPLWDPDPGVRGTIGRLDPRSRYEYWATLRLDLRVRFRNCGVYGERTDQIAARFDRCTRGAGAVIVQGGINDIAQRRSPARAAANLDAMVARAERRGLRAVLVTVLPWNNGYPAAKGPIDALNRRIEAIGRARRVPVLAFGEALADPARPGRMRPGLTDDGDHPNVAGYRRLGALVTPRALGIGRRR